MKYQSIKVDQVALSDFKQTFLENFINWGLPLIRLK